MDPPLVRRRKNRAEAKRTEEKKRQDPRLELDQLLAPSHNFRGGSR